MFYESFFVGNISFCKLPHWFPQQTRKTGRPNNPFSVNFHIENEDDTLGNTIQSILHNKYIRISNKHKGIICSYVGYICPHPLKQLMIIRITLDEQTDTEKFKQFLIDNCYDIIRELETIKTDWITFSSKKK